MTTDEAINFANEADIEKFDKQIIMSQFASEVLLSYLFKPEFTDVVDHVVGDAEGISVDHNEHGGAHFMLSHMLMGVAGQWLDDRECETNYDE